jgi:hypothetical protein
MRVKSCVSRVLEAETGLCGINYFFKRHACFRIPLRTITR